MLDSMELDQKSIEATIGILLKYQDDIEMLKGEEVERILTNLDSELMASQSKDSL